MSTYSVFCTFCIRPYAVFYNQYTYSVFCIMYLNCVFYSETLNNNTSKEFIKCRILHFLILECCRYLVF